MSDQSKECWACRTPMKANQSYCTECRKWQNWRRYTDLSSTVLALVIALFSVSGLLFQLGTETFKSNKPLLSIGAKMNYGENGKASSIVLEPVNFDEEAIELHRNLECGVSIFDSAMPKEFDIMIRTENPTIILPGQQALIKYSVDNEQFDELQDKNFPHIFLKCELDIARPGGWQIYFMIENGKLMYSRLEQ